MMIVSVPRVQDDVYYQGAFWIMADSYRDLRHGVFSIVGEKIPVNYRGEILRKQPPSVSHKDIWEMCSGYGHKDKPYDYFPRGRVCVYGGMAYVSINDLCYAPKVINAIVREFNLKNLEFEIRLNDDPWDDNYDFRLK